MLLTSSLNSNLKVMPKIIFAFSSSDNSTVLFMLFFKYFKNALKMHHFVFSISSSGEESVANLGTRDFLLLLLKNLVKCPKN